MLEYISRPSTRSSGIAGTYPTRVCAVLSAPHSRWVYNCHSRTERVHCVSLYRRSPLRAPSPAPTRLLVIDIARPRGRFRTPPLPRHGISHLFSNNVRPVNTRPADILPSRPVSTRFQLHPRSAFVLRACSSAPLTFSSHHLASPAGHAFDAT